jgi:hypothetical protein
VKDEKKEEAEEEVSLAHQLFGSLAHCTVRLRCVMAFIPGGQCDTEGG